jgi:hypothetical protein
MSKGGRKPDLGLCATLNVDMHNAPQIIELCLVDPSIIEGIDLDPGERLVMDGKLFVGVFDRVRWSQGRSTPSRSNKLCAGLGGAVIFGADHELVLLNKQ